jgi:hypothetical protein
VDRAGDCDCKYIQRVEKRTLPVIAFIHRAVGREGIRDLLQLNPILFKDETEIISALPQRLVAWKELTTASIRLQLQFPGSVEEQHRTRKLIVSVANGSNQRIASFNCQVRLPTVLLKHGDLKGFLPDETKTDDPKYSCYRFDELYKPAIAPHATEELMVFPCRFTCAVAATGEIPPIAAAIIQEEVIHAKLWVDGREYEIEKTIHDLIAEAESAKQ